jgi:hypothetical protein
MVGGLTMAVKKYMDHNLYMAALKKRSDDALLYGLQDARSALDAMPDGINAGFYADEVHYFAMEIRRRSNGNTV